MYLKDIEDRYELGLISRRRNIVLPSDAEDKKQAQDFRDLPATI